MDQIIKQYSQEVLNIIRDLADLGNAIEDMGNECFLCSYQPIRYQNEDEKCTCHHDPYCSIGRAMMICKGAECH